MSKIISDEEIATAIALYGSLASRLIQAPQSVIIDLVRIGCQVQRDASDQEWIEWIEKHRWESQSLIPGISTIKGYLITDEELQAIRLQAIKQKMKGD